MLATSLTGDPLLCAFDRPEGKVLVLTVNLDKSDLPLQTAFPILVSNALAGSPAAKGELRESLAAGAVTEVELPAPGRGQASGCCDRPTAGRRPLPRGARQGDDRPARPLRHLERRPRPGTSRDATSRRLELACNLASRQESDLRPAAGLDDHRGVAAGLGSAAGRSGST